MDMPEYTDCPECKGSGKVLIPEQWPTGYTEVWHKCEFCWGRGYFETEEYVMMKLVGEV